jgi:hypothetical protein
VDEQQRLKVEQLLQALHLGAIIEERWPNTDIRWMDHATRQKFIGRWMQQASSWLFAIGALPEELAKAAGGVAERWEKEAGARRRSQKR